MSGQYMLASAVLEHQIGNQVHTVGKESAEEIGSLARSGTHWYN